VLGQALGRQLTPRAARDLARGGVTINVAQAGLMHTDMEPSSMEVLEAMVSGLAIQRISNPAETAAVIAFLASPAASYIAGAVIDSNAARRVTHVNLLAGGRGRPTPVHAEVRTTLVWRGPVAAFTSSAGSRGVVGPSLCRGRRVRSTTWLACAR
jgi:hypothetical protein